MALSGWKERMVEIGFDLGMGWILYWLIKRQGGNTEEFKMPHGKKEMVAEIAKLAVNQIVVGPRSGKGDEAIFSGLVNQLEPRLRDNITELVTYEKMTGRVEEFRFTIALMAEKLREEKTLATLRAIAEQPTVEERFLKVETEGLLAPSDRKQVHEEVKKFFVQATRSFSGKWPRIVAEMQSASASTNEIFVKKDPKDMGLLQRSQSFRERMEQRFNLARNR